MAELGIKSGKSTYVIESSLLPFLAFSQLMVSSLKFHATSIKHFADKFKRQVPGQVSSMRLVAVLPFSVAIPKLRSSATVTTSRVPLLPIPYFTFF